MISETTTRAVHDGAHADHALPTPRGDGRILLSVVIPVAVYIGLIYLLHSLLLRSVNAVHLLLAALTAAVLVGAVLLALSGVSMAVCLVVVTAAPAVAVIGDEWVGHRRTAAALAARTGA